MEKLKHLLKHWIEHSKEHNAKYLEWAEKVKDERPDIAELIVKAVEKFEEGEKLLEEAYNKL
jgi:DNA gyrase/topoisomerase IV subunit A